jgi:hypothetical protein
MIMSDDDIEAMLRGLVEEPSGRGCPQGRAQLVGKAFRHLSGDAKPWSARRRWARLTQFGLRVRYTELAPASAWLCFIR